MGLQTNKYHWAPPLRRSSQQNYFVSICWWHFFLALYLNSWLNHHVVLHFILPISTIQLLLSLHRLGRFSPSPVNHTHIYFCCFNRHFCWVNLHQTLFFLVESPRVLTSHDRFFAIIFRLIMNIISLDWRYRNYLDLMSQLCGSDILAYDYCGYGFSTGRPSEENCYESIEARGGPGGGKDGGIIELDIWPVTWGYTQIYI